MDDGFSAEIFFSWFSQKMEWAKKRQFFFKKLLSPKKMERRIYFFLIKKLYHGKIEAANPSSIKLIYCGLIKQTEHVMHRYNSLLCNDVYKKKIKYKKALYIALMLLLKWVWLMWLVVLSPIYYLTYTLLRHTQKCCCPCDSLYSQIKKIYGQQKWYNLLH